ncbi:3554_t:CDS:2, partial [Gigaspora margarita]
MRYPKGKNQGKIISPYLQQQLVKVISNSLYRPQSSYVALQKEYLKSFSSDNFKKQVKELFKSNNRHCSPDMIWLTTKLAQVGQVSIRSTVECTRLIYEFLTGEPPKGWLSRGRVTTWHKQVSELAISNLIKNTQQTSVFGISADESTRGQDKNLIICFMYWDKEQNYPIASM